MRVVTFDARRRDGNIGIDRFKDLFRAGRHCTCAGIGSVGTGLHFLQPRRSNSVPAALALLIGH